METKKAFQEFIEDCYGDNEDKPDKKGKIYRTRIINTEPKKLVFQISDHTNDSMIMGYFNI